MPVLDRLRSIDALLSRYGRPSRDLPQLDMLKIERTLELLRAERVRLAARLGGAK